MSTPLKLIIVGATGYIGKHLYSNAPAKFHLIGTSSRADGEFLFLNLEIPSRFDFEILGVGDVVLLSAAISAPDICANEYARAWAVNVKGTEEFITQVMSRGGRVIFFSSDTVYGECVNSFNETRKSNPAGEYAQMKTEVEKRFFGNPLFKSIRLSYVFSREDKFTKYLFECAKTGKKAELFHPFYRSIIHRNDVIEGALALADHWDDFPQQVINFGGPDVLSKVDFAQCLRQYVLPDLRFQASEPDEEFFKNRPRVIAMSSEILPMLLERRSRTLVEAVQLEFK